MEVNNERIRIGVFGHYGNKNLGDEAIIEAVIKNLRQKIPGCDIVCLSINPFDSRDRYQVESFPIRYRRDFFEDISPARPSSPSEVKDDSQPLPVKPVPGLKQRLKSLPVLGHLLKCTAGTIDAVKSLRQEVAFLGQCRAYLNDIDLLLITGSNQFLDNFGGPWGFPYTLFKWTILAKTANTNVAFISIGAGPLSNRLSYWFIKNAINRASYLSYRDEGSRALIASRIDHDALVYPDIAHSLQAPRNEKGNDRPDGVIKIAVNPMPVYDSRYWYHADDNKFISYVDKLSELCAAILNDGHALELFSTQSKDENVIDDVVDRLRLKPQYTDWSNRIDVAKSKQVNELMQVLDRSDLVIATRFHATVLPLQLGKPVLGICYYRKAVEQLKDVGLGDYFVDIDDFDVDTLIGKYRALLNIRLEKAVEIDRHMNRYVESLDDQYQTIADLISGSNSKARKKNALPFAQ